MIYNYNMIDKHLPHNHGTDETSLIKEFPNDEVIESVADVLKQLGDPSRLRIFWLLCHTEECVTNIAAMTEMTSPAVSHHLRILKNSGLITSRREGKEMYYKALDNKLVNSMHQMIEKIGDIRCPKSH